MKETELTAIQTPSGNTALKEANSLLSVKLVQVTTPDPGDFRTQETKDYLTRVYKEASDYRRYLFGGNLCRDRKLKSFFI